MSINSEAAKYAQQAILEVIKAGALPVTQQPGERSGEAAADFIIAAHKKLTTYYETL